ncbi:MAG: putative zinc-binding metallopeptidase [Mangrovibacterium sp.]
MKNIKYIFIALVIVSLWGCAEEELDPNSIFGSDATVQNEFDTWIVENYTNTYNINLKYRFEDRESNPIYNLIPADYDKSIAMAKITKHFWLESYEELLGLDFMRTYSPRVLFFVGSPAYNSSQSKVVATAEGGLKITLYEINALDLNNINAETLNTSYFHTMHHEFAHILHQTKNYPTSFEQISANDYQSSSWVNVVLQDALNMGFISPYGSSEPREDFAETVAYYVAYEEEFWNNRVAQANEDGQEIINKKLAIIKEYMETSWGINMDELRTIIQRRAQEVSDLDVTTLN